MIVYDLLVATAIVTSALALFLIVRPLLLETDLELEEPELTATDWTELGYPAGISGADVHELYLEHPPTLAATIRHAAASIRSFGDALRSTNEYLAAFDREDELLS